MAFKVADRVKQKSSTVGIGDIELTNIVDSFQGFGDVLNSGDTTFYVAESGDEWEVGLCTYAPNSLERTSVFSSSNNGSKISLNGNSTISLTYPSERAVYLDESLDIVAIGSGISFSDGPHSLNFNNGNLYWDNNQLAYKTDSDYASGIAVYASGQSVSNQQSIEENNIDIAYISGIAVFASGESLSYLNYQNSSSSINLNIENDVVFIDSTSSLVNVYIPPASGNGGKEIKVKRVSGENEVNIIPSGDETIDGQSSYPMLHLYQSTTITSNNINWFIT